MVDRSELDERIAKCRKILDENPSSQIFAALAEAHRKKGELDIAFRICQSGLKIHPDYGSAHMVMAKINMDKGLYDWAESEAVKAIELDGTTRAAELLLAEIYIYKGEFNKACRLLEKLHEGDRDNEHIKKLLDIAHKIPLGVVHNKEADSRPVDAEPPTFLQKKKVPGVEKVEQSAEAVSTPAPAVDLSEKQMLRALIGTPGVDGALMVKPDGLVIESEWNIDGDSDLVAAMTAEAARFCTKQMRDGGFGNLNSMMVETADSLTYLAGARGRLLTVVCSNSVNLGSLKMKMSNLVERLAG